MSCATVPFFASVPLVANLGGKMLLLVLHLALVFFFFPVMLVLILHESFLHFNFVFELSLLQLRLHQL